MKFPYREFVSILPGSQDFQLILRPVITVKIKGPAAEARWDALLDTGADETLLPRSLADVLGVQLDQQMTSLAAGISGKKLTIYYGEVEFEIADEHHHVEWKSIVGFVDFDSADDEVIILGHGGCLDYFTAVFDGERGEVELISNSLLPSE